MNYWLVLAWAALLFALGAIAFLVSSRLAPQPSADGEVVRHFLRGQKLLGEGRFQEAISELETVTRLAPESVGGHHELARAYDAVGRPADALREMRTMLRLTMTDDTAREPIRRSEEADLRFELATLLAKNGEFAEAAEELGKVARLDSFARESLEYLIALGIAQAGRGRSESARGMLATALELSPDVARQSLQEWIADRPTGPEAPLLQRLLAEASPAAEPEPEPAPSPVQTPETPPLIPPDASPPP